MTQMVVAREQPLTVADHHARIDVIQRVLREVMKKDVHYGTIPGTPKPTLYKPGAEVICTTFGLAARPEVYDLSTPDEAKYRVMMTLYARDGTVVASASGECSSHEAKYKWRGAVCDEEFNDTPADRRRELWKKGKENAYKVKQVRTEPADMANTVLKMAEKRALIAVVRLGTAASDVFEQDLEDMENPPEENRQTMRPPQAREPQQPNESREGERLITEKQRMRFYALYKEHKKTNEQAQAYLRDTFGIEHSNEIPMSIYDEVCKWAQS